MYPDQSLRENIIHGTPQNPIHAMHFTAPLPERFFVERHWHHYVEIIYIAKGSYLFEINLESHTLSQGDICFLNSEDLHQLTGNELSAVHDVVLFDPRILGFSYKDEWELSYAGPFLNRALTTRDIRKFPGCFPDSFPGRSRPRTAGIFPASFCFWKSSVSWPPIICCSR